MSEKCFFTIKRNDGNRMITEEIPISSDKVEEIQEMLGLQLQRSYNADYNNRNSGNYPTDRRHERQGPTTEKQRRCIDSMRQNTTQRNRMDQYAREKSIDWETLTNAEANEIIQAGRN